jgi:hypothetical protein
MKAAEATHADAAFLAFTHILLVANYPWSYACCNFLMSNLSI